MNEFFEIDFRVISFLENVSGNFIRVQPVPVIQEDKHVVTSTVREASC